MRKKLLLLPLLLLSLGLAAQTASDSIFPALRIGEWQQHLPWQRAVSVTNSTDKVYYATEWAVVEIDKEDRSPYFLTKVTGLSDVGMSLVRFNRAANVLFISYANSNLDLYYPSDGHVLNLPFILKNTTLSGDKRVYDIFFDGEFAYLSTGFGALKVNLTSAEVEFTVFTGTPVRAFAVHEGRYFLGTDDGLFSLPTDDVNPADFERWKSPDTTAGLPLGEGISALAVFDNQLLLGVDTLGLYRFDGDEYYLYTKNGNLPVDFLTTEGAGLLVGWRANDAGNVQYYSSLDGIGEDVQGPCEANRSLWAIEDGTRRFWFADESEQFRYFDQAGNLPCERFVFNSPYTHHITEISLRGKKVFIATRGADQNLNALGAQEGVYLRNDDGQWRRFNGDSNPELVNGSDTQKDWWRVTPDPEAERFWIGSYSGGLIRMNDDGSDSEYFTDGNSVLGNGGTSGSNRTIIGGMAFDEDGNLWLNNYGASKPIAVVKPDGQIKNFSAPFPVATQVVVDASGYKWFAGALGNGVLVYDSGADLDDPSDDQYRQITPANSVLASNGIGSLAVDLDGDVWVGTDGGLYSFECGSNVFSTTSPCRGTRQIITVDGFGGYLLQDENIRTIAVDGANRKWVGTDNGIFVQSSDGRTTVARYTATNSPLLSNTVYDIAINGQTGEAWIGTSAGLLSLRIDATEGGRVNSPKTYAYPNPVRPDYDGPIAIYGLARDANVKITDVAGHLVYEGTALGGQAVWDGRDYLGRRAASGVYLVYATSSESFDAPDAIITKVVILN